jgi:hypothetical protein
VLDDATKLLASLHVGAGRGRRGRIDIAAMLCEIAPNAKVRLEPGSGTEVNGEETELRRMLQVMLAHSSGTNSMQGNEVPEVSIERDRDDVRVSVTLGPDIAAAASTERAWLSRMAMRYGGRFELQGSQECLYLPAEGAIEKSEVAQLRKELQEAQKQGEAYARELAAVFAAGDTETTMTSSPSSIPPATDAIVPTAALALSTAAELRNIALALTKDIEGLRERHSEAPSIADTQHRRVVQLNELVSELNRFGKVPLDELPMLVDLVYTAKEAINDAQARSARHAVELQLSNTAPLQALVQKAAVRALIRAMLDHGIAASIKDSSVCVQVELGDKTASVIVDDSGASIPANARDALILRRLDPASVARPTSISLLCASMIVSHLSGTLSLSDSPKGGCRTVATFPTL